MKPTAIIAILLAGALGYFVNHFTLAPKLKVAQETVVRLETEKNALQEQMVSMQGRMLSDAERRRMERERKELASLRGEIAQLRKKIQDQEQSQLLAAQKAKQAAAGAESQELEEEEFEPSDYYAATLNVALELGMTLVTGGWQTSPGRRTFMFMTPTMGSSNSGSGYLQFVSKVAELDDSELEAFFLDNMRVSGNETDQAGGFDAEDAASLFEGIKRSPTGKLLGLPTVVTNAGKEAVVSTSFQIPSDTGAMLRKLELGVLPILNEDGQMELTLAATISLPEAEMPAEEP